MPKVHEVNLTPVKSMRAQENVTSLHVDSDGMFGDRQYMLVEAAEHENKSYLRKNYPQGKVQTGHFLSQREDPILTHFQPTLLPDGLMLEVSGHGRLVVPSSEDTAEHRLPVSVWGWNGEALDQGDLAAEWSSDVIGRPVRLVEASQMQPRHVEARRKLGQMGFADGYPFTVASVNGYAKVNEKLGELGYPDGIPVENTRTTLTLEDLEPPVETDFPEDYINRIIVASEGLELVLRRQKACGRCTIPDTNQTTGERPRNRPFLSALNHLDRLGNHADKAKYGDGAAVFFSQNFVIESSTVPQGLVIPITKNAEIGVEYAHTTNWNSRWANTI